MSYYIVDRYHGAGSAVVEIWCTATLQEARALARRVLGVRRLSAARRWSPPEEMGGGEAYSAAAPSEAGSEGCEVVHIRPLPVTGCAFCRAPAVREAIYEDGHGDELTAGVPLCAWHTAPCQHPADPHARWSREEAI